EHDDAARAGHRRRRLGHVRDPSDEPAGVVGAREPAVLRARAEADRPADRRCLDAAAREPERARRLIDELDDIVPGLSLQLWDGGVVGWITDWQHDERPLVRGAV